MGTIPAFWVGAMEQGRDLDLLEVERRGGGWAALEHGGPDALVVAGVLPHVAHDWWQAEPRCTRGRPVTLADPNFPQALRELDPPPVLLVEGNLEALTGRAVAVVGTRQCSPYGAGVARHLGAALSRAGVCVVSGLARGIDAHAHRGALATGRTVAVLAHGLAHTAPLMHHRLRASIVSAGGALVTTWFDEAPPRPWQFPPRNRWIAALGWKGVVVVEAGARSGTMHTVAAANAHGRDVYAVPGRIGDPAAVGCLQLLAEGAAPIVDVEAWVAGIAGVATVRAPEAWLDEVLAGRSIDEVARSSGVSTSELLARLSILELQGEVVRLPGQRYGRGRRDTAGS